MQNMDRNFANEIRTVREEMNELKGSVEGVRTAMKMGKVEVTNKTTAVKREIYKLGQVEMKNQELGAVKNDLNEVTETQRDMELVKDELHQVKEEQTQI